MVILKRKLINAENEPFSRDAVFDDVMNKLLYIIVNIN